MEIRAQRTLSPRLLSEISKKGRTLLPAFFVPRETERIIFQ